MNANIQLVCIFIIIEGLFALTCSVFSLYVFDPLDNSINYYHIIHLSYGIKPLQTTHKVKIGFVKPTFTDAAYDNKFYIFYYRHLHTPWNVNVTKDLPLLNSKVSNIQRGSVHNVFALTDLIKHMGGISNRTLSYSLSDIDVDKGNIFDNINHRPLNLFDILVIGHQEYVTQQEYNNLKQFVLNGGTIILLDGNVFYAEVKYFENNNTISLVKGHGWAFNGKTAWRSVGERWANETSQWVGSNYLCYKCIKLFKNNPFGYLPHEEQYITNPKDKILLNFDPIQLSNAPKPHIDVAIYSLKYGKGKIISFGIYSDDIIQNKYFDSYFNRLFTQLLESLPL